MHMPFGVGVVNAYAVVDCATGVGVLFDGGIGFEALQQVWPKAVTRIEAVFLTHPEAEHIGGVAGALRQHGLATFYGPRCGPTRARVLAAGRGRDRGGGGLPDHGVQHAGALRRAQLLPRAAQGRAARPARCSSRATSIFAGSLGGGYFSCAQLLRHARRILEALPGYTVIAPGHGPMTTVENERKYNPFLV